MNNLLKRSGLRGKTSQRKAFYQMTDVLFQLLHDFSLQEHKAVKHSVSSSTEIHGAGSVDKVYQHQCTAYFTSQKFLNNKIIMGCLNFRLFKRKKKQQQKIAVVTTTTK